MPSKTIKISRRQILKGGVLAVGAAIAGTAATRRALAQAAPKAAKAAFQYQDKPKDGKKCVNCSLYIPGAKGQCKVVEGDISPEGWCIAYVEAPKK
ncbi:MAG: high-potential iron-sulfur protein [Burkholderiales bacterium]